jgi:hypothetical protein
MVKFEVGQRSKYDAMVVSKVRPPNMITSYDLAIQ